MNGVNWYIVVVWNGIYDEVIKIFGLNFVINNFVISG